MNSTAQDTDTANRVESAFARANDADRTASMCANAAKEWFNRVHNGGQDSDAAMAATAQNMVDQMTKGRDAAYRQAATEMAKWVVNTGVEAMVAAVVRGEFASVS